AARVSRRCLQARPAAVRGFVLDRLKSYPLNASSLVLKSLMACRGCASLDRSHSLFAFNLLCQNSPLPSQIVDLRFIDLDRSGRARLTLHELKPAFGVDKVPDRAHAALQCVSGLF